MLGSSLSRALEDASLNLAMIQGFPQGMLTFLYMQSRQASVASQVFPSLPACVSSLVCRVLDSILTFPRFILFGRQNDKETETQRQKEAFYPLACSPEGVNSHIWARLKPGPATWSLTWITGTRVLGSFSVAFPGWISTRLDRKWSSRE